jgi:hypothetical protein
VTALIKERMSSFERWTYKEFPLAVGNKAFQGAIAALDLSTGKVEPGHAETDLFVIGKFAETVDATAAEALVNVNLGMEIEVEWWDNSGTNPVAATDVGSLCYVEDDQTAAISASGGSVLGRVWAVDALRGVAVEKLQSVPGGSGGAGLVETDPGAFASNDLVIAASPNSGSIYDIPATGAASTVTLPAAADEGAMLHFVADGAKNAHTVQYRDATGPTNLTTALTASKRHQVTAIFLNGKWTANAYVSP